MSGVSNRIRGSSVTRAIRLMGDRWSLLVLRDAFQGVRRFEEMVERTGASRSTLARRLRSLVSGGLLERIRYTSTPPRWEYRLTPRGRDLFALSVVARDWEYRWAPRGSGLARNVRHACGATLRAETVCTHCGDRLVAAEIDYVPRPGVVARALPRAARSRRISTLTGATHRGSHHTLAHIADIVGDPWTPLVVAASFLGVRRFDGFQRELGIATNILAARLDLLVTQKVMKRRQYLRQPPRYEYKLTAKGLDLLAYAVVLNAWADRWLVAPGKSTLRPVHRRCGKEFTPVVRCAACHEPVTMESLSGPGSRPAV
jgi:DNA-binding HxlR family transcriptional regulator